MIKSWIFSPSSLLWYLFGISIVLWQMVIPGHSYGLSLINIQPLFEIKHDLKQPSDVAVSEKGFIYVVDGVNNKIKVFNQKAEYIFSFGGRGSSKGQFLFPLGIDVDVRDRVYVADSGNHRVQVFDAFGGFLSRIPLDATGEIRPDPTDVVVDDDGRRMYIVDNDNHTILVYDLESNAFVQSFGSPGTEKREFRYPFQISLDQHSYLYIVDVINTRLQVLNADGRFVTFIGGWGVNKGEFFRPKGVAIDPKSRVYVSDSYMGVIQVFRPSGEFIAALGNVDTKTVKKFKTPTGIFIDKRNQLYVVEMFANRIGVYKIEDGIH